MNRPFPMHPSPVEHAHSLRNGRLRWAVLGLIAALWWTGCGTDSPSAPLLTSDDTLFSASSEERTAALAVLDSMKRDVIQEAFKRLPHYAFTRRVRTEQFSPAGSLMAARERVLRFPPSDSALRPLVVRADSSGTFQFDLLDAFVPTGDENVLPTELGRYALPNDPAYLEPRTREAFRYRLLTDTLAGQPVQVVEVHAQPGDLGADRAIRHARLYIEPNSHELVGLYLVRADATLLFREDSRSLVRLRPAPDSGWVPALTRFYVRVKVPLRPAQAFRTIASYSAYRPIE